MKRILLTCTDLMAIQFMVPHIRYLAENGFYVELACSIVGNRYNDLKKAVDNVAKIHTVRLERNPFSLNNLKGYKDMKKILSENTYDLIWTNEPVMGVMTRLAAREVRKKGTKVLYMAHGFHFCKGAPLIDWLLWSPTEYIMSHFNDFLVTINWEDYNWAKKHFKTPEVIHLDGIGVDLSRYVCSCSRDEKRSQLGISKDDVLLLSVGELEKRKNQKLIIKALSKAKNPNVKCIICGKGSLEKSLKDLVSSLGLENRVVFLGYRQDIPEIMIASDIYAHPSIREGLGIASLEAMASGLPLVASNTRGIADYIEQGVNGFMCKPDDAESFAKNLDMLSSDEALREMISQNNLLKVQQYKIEVIRSTLKELLDDCLSDHKEIAKV